MMSFIHLLYYLLEVEFHGGPQKSKCSVISHKAISKSFILQLPMLINRALRFCKQNNTLGPKAQLDTTTSLFQDTVVQLQTE